MVTRHQEHITSTTFLLLAAAVGIVYAFYTTYGPLKPELPNRILIPIGESSPTPIPTMTPAPLPQPATTTQISPDGKKQLTMTVTTNKDFSKTYAFVTTNADGSNAHSIYSATYNSDAMSIPFNTWSPDDMYVFITHITPTLNEELVLRADGQPITAAESPIDLTSTFVNKVTNNTYDQTTGWASDTLLVVNTKQQDGTQGTSYWFEVPDKAIIPLSTKF